MAASASSFAMFYQDTGQMEIILFLLAEFS